MNRKFILGYLILLVILIICAGAAWYLTNLPKEPVEDAVLVEHKEKNSHAGADGLVMMKIEMADGRCIRYAG